jgi:hypothetical protein
MDSPTNVDTRSTADWDAGNGLGARRDERIGAQ